MNILKKYNVFQYLFVFLIVFIFTTFLEAIVYGDYLWFYGFCYNTSLGILPYRDFNMIIGPFFPYLFGFLMNILGREIYVFNIFGAFIVTGIFHYIKKYNSTILAYFVILFYISNLFFGYNVISLLIFFIIYDLEIRKKNDYLIGIFLGIVLLTKINMFFLLFIPTIILCWKDKNKILKRLFSCLFLVLLFFIFLFCTNSLFQFIDYTILGLFKFSGNLYFDYTFILLILTFIYLVFTIFKRKKYINIYPLCFLFLSYPIFDWHHVCISIIPSIVICFSYLKKFKSSRMVNFLIIFIYLVFIIFNFCSDLDNYSKDRNLPLYRYGYGSKPTIELNKKISSILYRYSDSKIFILTTGKAFPYDFKINNNIPIDKFDIINNGNFGSDGASSYIKEIDDYCKRNNCVFLINLFEYKYKGRDLQTNKKILKYVIDNYNKRKFYNYRNIYIYDNKGVCSE